MGEGGRGGGGGCEEGAGGDLNDAPLIRALSPHHFMLVIWPSRFLHSHIIYRNVSYLIHPQNNI